MIWSDPTNKTGIVEDCDYWAATNSSTYPLADKARSANRAMRQIGRRMIRNLYGDTHLDDNATDFNIEYTSLVSGQDNVTLQVGAFSLERVRVKDTAGNYQTLQQVSRSELTDQDLKETGTPTKFYRAGQSILLNPTPNYSVADTGIEVEYQKSLEQEFQATGADDRTPGFHEDYHPLVSIYMAMDYTIINNPERYRALKEVASKIEFELDEDFQKRSRAYRKKLGFKKNQRHIV